MECMEARALKSSFISEVAMKSTNPQGFYDDIWCVTGLNGVGGGVGGDDFSIDEFFDLPNEDGVAQNASFLEEEEEEEEKYSSSLSLSSQDPVDDTFSNDPNFSPDLAIPVDDVQELELWSHFMDDSVPEPNLACPNPLSSFQHKKPGFNFMNRDDPVRKPGVGRVPFMPSVVPVKPRTKRPRTPGSRSSSSSSSSPVSTLFFPCPVFAKPPVKKQKKKPATVGDEPFSGSSVQRKCSHCQVTKTPQWRAGPNGPKTLCNACGVRFKSGRLFPEYRPACSPTFSSEVHSNSHRKVLEMRRKKEMTDGFSPAVSS